MSGFQRFKERAAEPEVDTAGCKANGCPCRGSVDVGGGFACRYHVFAESHLWPSITEKLREHDWFIGFMADINRLPSKAWREFAKQFWQEAEPLMVPGNETRELYAYRLHLSLAHRVGAGPAAPLRIKPQGEGLPVKSRGNFAEAVA